MVFLNGNLVLSLCKSQTTIALSSCEAELLAMTHMTAEAIMVCNLCRFLLKLSGRDSDMDFLVYTDSSSAKSLAQRRGVGRLKHVDLRHLWVQSCVRRKLLRLKKIGTKNNVADLNTKNLSVARRRYLFGLCGLSEDQKKITISNTTDIHFSNPSIVQRIALVLAGLPMVEAVSMEDQRAGLWIWTLLAMVCLLIAVLVWMVPGSPDSPGETASQRRRRYMNSELSEVSDPETWMLYNHHSEMEDDEPEGELRSDVPRADSAQRTQTYDSRIFLMFTMIVDQKYGQWGRRHQPHFEWEAENWTTDDALLKTFKQMRVMALCLDDGKLSQVEEMLQLIEEDGDNARILAGLNRLAV